MIKKQAYVAPNTKIRSAELEAIICQSVQVDAGFGKDQAIIEDDSEDTDWGW